MDIETILFYAAVIIVNATAAYAMYHITRRYYDRKVAIDSERLAVQARDSETNAKRLALEEWRFTHDNQGYYDVTEIYRQELP